MKCCLRRDASNVATRESNHWRTHAHPLNIHKCASLRITKIAVQKRSGWNHSSSDIARCLSYYSRLFVMEVSVVASKVILHLWVTFLTQKSPQQYIPFLEDSTVYHFLVLLSEYERCNQQCYANHNHPRYRFGHYITYCFWYWFCFRLCLFTVNHCDSESNRQTRPIRDTHCCEDITSCEQLPYVQYNFIPKNLIAPRYNQTRHNHH